METVSAEGKSGKKCLFKNECSAYVCMRNGMALEYDGVGDHGG